MSASALHPFLTRLVTSPAAARFLPAIEDSDSPCALCARMLQRAFNEQRIGNADCMRKAAVLIPKWGWPTYAVDIRPRRNAEFRIIIFIDQGKDDSTCTAKITVANMAWHENLDSFQQSLAAALPDLADRFTLGHDGNAYIFDEHLTIPDQVDRLDHVVTVLTKRLMGPIPGPTTLAKENTDGVN